MDQTYNANLCRLIIDEPDSSQVILKNCSEDAAIAVNKAFIQAAKDVGLTDTTALPELSEAQLRALNWAAVDAAVDSVHCLLPDCNLDAYRNQAKATSQANPFHNQASTTNNPFDGPVNIPSGVYLAIALIALSYLAMANGFNSDKAKQFIDKFLARIRNGRNRDRTI
jgi:hypothetical protein